MEYGKAGAALALLLALVATAPAGAEDIAPLRRGYYLRADVPCDRASHATLTLYTGKSFGTSCKAEDIQTAAHAVRISQTCRDRGFVTRSSQLYRITSDHEFIVGLDGEDIPHRLCPQADLPLPWSATDLSGLLRCGDTE